MAVLPDEGVPFDQDVVGPVASPAFGVQSVDVRNPGAVDGQVFDRDVA
jgi:hypothetical protein